MRILVAWFPSRWAWVVLFGGSTAALSSACIGDDSSTPTPAADASSDGGASDSSVSGDSSAAGDSSVSGDSSAAGDSSRESTAGGDAGTATPVFVAHFDLAAGQQPEGLWELAGDAGAPTPIVGFAPLASLVTVNANGTSQPFGSLGPATNTFTLGITTDGAHNVYVGIGANGASPVPATGIYQFPAGGGTGVVFSAGASATPPMNFPNGLDFVGTDLFVSDSGGTIYKIAPSGVATAWSTDPLLVGDNTTCGGFQFDLGANGIVHDANNVYVANTTFGRLIKIPLQSDGGAGAASVIVESCELKGADGLAFDTKDNTILMAVNIQNRIERITLTGTRTVVASGAPLDAPASLFIETTSSGRRLLVTNASFFSGDAGRPGLLALPLP
jgi:hypothetical protein